MLSALLKSQFDKSGTVFNEEHSPNIKVKSLTFPTSHFDISGIDFKEEHL